MFAHLASFLVLRRIPILALLSVVVVVASLLSFGVRFDFSPQAIFSGNGQLVADAERFRETFGHEDAILLVILEATGEQDTLTPASLNWQNAVVAKLRTLHDVQSVESMASLQVPQIHFTFGDPFKMRLGPLIPAFPVDAVTAEEVRARVDRMPLITGALLSESRRVAAIPVFVDPRKRDLESMKTVVHQVRAVLRNAATPNGFKWHLTGLPDLRVDAVENLQKDQAGLLPFAGVVYLLALVLMFRCVSGGLLPLVAVGVGLSFTFAILALTGQTLNVVSNVLPMLLLIIGISSSVQVVAAYGEDADEHGHDVRTLAGREAATRGAIGHMAEASLVASVTTAIGFLSLMTARSDVLKQFGIQSCIGVAMLYIALMTVLGTLFPYFRPPQRRSVGRLGRAFEQTVANIGTLVARHPRTMLASSALVVVAAISAGMFVRVNSYTFETYEESHPTLKTMRLVERELSGLLALEVSLKAKEGATLIEPDVYRKVAEFQHYALQQEGVLFARSYVDLHQELISRWSRTDRDVLPANDDDGRRRLNQSNVLLLKLEKAFHYSKFRTIDGTQARVMLRLKDIGTSETLVLARRLEATLTDLFPPGGPVTAHLTGDAYVNAVAMDNLIHDLFGALLTASFSIFGMIALLFRSIRVGLIAALPNLTPLALTLGYMGLRGYDMNVGNVIVFTISLGFADDTTIHFLFRFREEYRKDLHVIDAIQRTFLGTGRAIVQTSLLVVSGLLILLFSNFLPTRRFGELTLVTLAGNLLGVLLMLPACVVLFWKRTIPLPEPEFTESSHAESVSR